MWLQNANEIVVDKVKLKIRLFRSILIRAESTGKTSLRYEKGGGGGKRTN